VVNIVYSDSLFQVFVGNSLVVFFSGPQKIAQSLVHCHFAIVCSRITGTSQKCAEINC